MHGTHGGQSTTPTLFFPVNELPEMLTQVWRGLPCVNHSSPTRGEYPPGRSTQRILN